MQRRLQKREFVENDTFTVFRDRFQYSEAMTREMIFDQINKLDIEQYIKDFFETPCPTVIEYFKEKFSSIEQFNDDCYVLTVFLETAELEYLKLYVYFNLDNSCKTLINYK